MYLIQEQLVSRVTNRTIFKNILKLKTLPEEINNVSDEQEWIEYLKNRGDSFIFEERKLYIIKATGNGFINVLGEKAYIIL